MKMREILRRMPVALDKLLILMASCVAINAFAEGINCSFCDNSVLLTPKRAQCFLSIYHDRVERLEKSGRGFVEVGLDSCENGNPSRNKDPNSLLRPRPESSSFVYLDRKALDCLRAYILKIDDVEEFKPESKIYIAEICEQ